ncbi:unnamed protein product [Polarella glacialis]|uniref:Uncharacterized protein n=1 Tax=Polarella glacialis TaxID=89957 RepID=A0A813H7V8_POLGL|nr:unnamed protein product [Polarella glacialis]
MLSVQSPQPAKWQTMADACSLHLHADPLDAKNAAFRRQENSAASQNLSAKGDFKPTTIELTAAKKGALGAFVFARPREASAGAGAQAAADAQKAAEAKKAAESLAAAGAKKAATEATAAESRAAADAKKDSTFAPAVEEDDPGWKEAARAFDTAASELCGLLQGVTLAKTADEKRRLLERKRRLESAPEFVAAIRRLESHGAHCAE